MVIKLGSDFDYHVDQELQILKAVTRVKLQRTKPKTLLEKQIEAKVCDYAKSKGVLAYKFTSPARAAVPDRLFIGPDGRMWFCEFKREGQVPTPAQYREHDKLRQQMVNVFVIDNVPEGKLMIDVMVMGAV